MQHNIEDFTAYLEDDYDTKQLIAKLLYLVVNNHDSEKSYLPLSLREKAKNFVDGKTNAKIGDTEYSFQELMDMLLSNDREE